MENDFKYVCLTSVNLTTAAFFLICKLFTCPEGKVYN